MRSWSFEVQHGGLSKLPSSLQLHADQQRLAGATSFFVSEGGTLLNEPEKELVASILPGAEPSSVIARMSESVGWVFDCFEAELDQDYQFNYLKVSFVNLSPVQDTEDCLSGKMSTNHPDLPEAPDVSAERMLGHLTTAVRVFFSHVRAAVNIAGCETEPFLCDWVSMILSKS